MNSSVSWDLEIDPSVYRDVEKFPRKDVRRILDAIRALPANPYAGDIEKMKGEVFTWRRRIGSYRIFYKLLIRERRILVFRAERRTSATYQFLLSAF